MKRKAAPRDPLLIELIAAIGAGRIEFGPIHKKGQYVYGFCDDGNDNAIRINPACHVVDTVLHECLHRMRPAWSERSVLAKTKRIMSQLDDAEIDRIYQVILSTAKVSKKVATL
jgi:hypothetical protein